MTAQQYIDSIMGKHIDYDGAYGAQCVDIIKKYFPDVIGIPAIRNNAIDYWTNYPTASFTRISNTPSFVPIKGDIMIWGTSVGQYGHIAIVESANVNTFVSTDQNWPYDNGTGVAHRVTHNYSGVLGVLRPNKDVNFDQAAYDAAQAEQKRQEEAARVAKEESDRLAAEEAAKKSAEEARIALEAQQEADRLAKEEAERIALEQKALAEEQARLKAELEDKLRLEEEARIKLEKESQMFKGKRTFITIGLMVVVALQAVLPSFTVLSPEISAAIVTLLGALAAYFRSQA